MVTAVVNGGDLVSSEELYTLYRAAENLLAVQQAEDERIAQVLECAKVQPRSWLAAELDYDLSNVGKVLAGKIRPKRLLNQMSRLRERTNA